jgi:hypothetical protein
VITYRVWAAHLGVRLDKVEISIDGVIDLRGLFGIDERIRAAFNAVRIQNIPVSQVDERMPVTIAPTDLSALAHAPPDMAKNLLPYIAVMSIAPVGDRVSSVTMPIYSNQPGTKNRNIVAAARLHEGRDLGLTTACRTCGAKGGRLHRQR